MKINPFNKTDGEGVGGSVTPLNRVNCTFVQLAALD